MIRVRELRLPRFAYAGAVIARILLGYKLLSLRKKRLPEAVYRERLRAHDRRSAQRIYDAVVRLQGLMIKIGQTLGSRPDLLPEEYVRVLSRLQDQVPPRPFRVMRPHIEGELGAPLEEAFAEFDPEPIAAASLAQVYRARLKDGRDVAVKVVYPGMQRLVATDLRILKVIIWIDSHVWGAYPLEPAYRELATNIPHEVDMIHEAHNMEALAADLSHRPEVVIPKVVWDHTRLRVLTMEYIDGVKITDLPRLAQAGIDHRVLLPLLADVYMEQILRNGHFHADPHPGNLFGLPGNRLAILDFGLARRLPPNFHASFKATARSIFDGNGDGLADAMRSAGFAFKHADDEAYLATAEMIRTFSDPETYRNKELLEAVNDAWIKSMKKNPLTQMPGEIMLVMRVLGLLLGLISTLGPEIDFGKIILKHTDEPQASPSAGKTY